MNTEQRDQRGVASGTRGWLAVAVVAFVVAGSVSAGVVGVTSVELGASAGQAPAGAAAAGAASAGGASAGSAAGSGQAGPFSGLLPLADANATLAGAGANDTFGSALAHGDVNGDGVEDVVVGAALNDTASGNNSGAAYVFYGPVEEAEMAAASADLTLAGANEGDWAGYSVAAGDVNDDGSDDVVVGAPLADAGGQSAGSAYVVYGGDRAGTLSLADANHTFVGAGAGDRAGLSVGAVNRTGGDDVLVGAPRNDSTAPDAGAAYVVSDAATGTLSLSDATATLVGEGAGDLAGWSVAAAGDFDGDDDRDLVVGAPRNDSTAPDAGAAYVVTADASVLAAAPSGTTPLADADVKLTGVGVRDNAGWSVAAAGDVNDDGYGDVAVGAPFNGTGGSNAGAAYVVHGGSDASGTVSLSDAGTTLVGEGTGDRAGYSVSSAGSGDVTCDAFADVLVGAPGNHSTAPDAGAAYVVAGGERPPAVQNLSTATAKLVGEAEADHAGRAVSDAGDVTGDASDDVLVGAPSSDSGGFDAGSAYVLAGDCPEERTTTTTPLTTTTTATTTTTTPTTTTTTTPTTTETSTTTTTTQPPENGEVEVEFLNCSAVRISGDVPELEIGAFTYVPGIDTFITTVGPFDGTRVVNAESIWESPRPIVLDGVQTVGGGEPRIDVENPNLESCQAEAQPERPTASVVGTERTGDGTIEVTFRYENPNDLALQNLGGGLDGEIVSGSVPNTLEPGTHQFTVEWSPESDTDRLTWTVELGPYGYADDPLAVSTAPAGSIGDSDGDATTAASSSLVGSAAAGLAVRGRN
jgi:hypothetical protein